MNFCALYSFSKAEDAAAHKNYERSNTLSIQPVNDGYMKVFDENGKSLVLHRGEIALAKLEAQNNDLQVGDRIAITVGKVRKEFLCAAASSAFRCRI